MMQAMQHVMVTRGDAQLEVLTQGKGPPIVLLPSLGRGAADFDPSPGVSRLLAFACCGRSRAGSGRAPDPGAA